MKMKMRIFAFASFAFLLTGSVFAQDRTTVNATSYEVSDNLDLRAVASIFGDSRDLEDFERRLNDPKVQISNLDLNRDNEVDYLRVIESVEGNTHLIIIQAVLDRDVYQDVATVEVEKDRNNRIQVQVVGDVYMYGQNYIYEPVYVHTPIIYTSFWMTNYRPYASSWYWGYYPSYYYAWNPFPIFRYRNNINLCINTHHHYNYVNIRSSNRAMALHNNRRSNGYERQHPNHSFAQRNSNVSNRHELVQTRNNRNSGNRNLASTINSRGGTSANNTRSATATPRENARINPRSEAPGQRANTQTRGETPVGNTRAQAPSQRVNTQTRSEAAVGNTRTQAPAQRANTQTRSEAPGGNTRAQAPSQRVNTQTRSQSPGGNSRAQAPSQRSSSPQGNTSQRGNSGQRSSGRG